jgi:cell fate (sporulation/competence/biofilm development) regulator YmcA (YheA/YmcA/DUF963 family)
MPFIDPRTNRQYAVALENLVTIGALFGLTEEEVCTPDIGRMIVEEIKNYQTSYTIIKNINLRKSTPVGYNQEEVLAKQIQNKISSLPPVPENNSDIESST